MKLTFLGSGAAFFPPSQGNFQSNMVLTASSGKRLLIDCGTQVHQSMEEQGLWSGDIDAVYISHKHADHLGGMEEFAIKTYFGGTPRQRLFAEAKMTDEMWAECLRGGLGSFTDQRNTLETFFDVVRIPRGGRFDWQGITFEQVPMIHYHDGIDVVPSYGLSFLAGRTSVLLTTDTQFHPDLLMERYRQADIIFHDCETADKSGVHAHYDDLITLPADIRAKMWLYHFQPGPKPDAAGFLGWVAKGQSFFFSPEGCRA